MQMRIEKLREKMNLKGFDALLIQNVSNIFYLTGMIVSSGTLLINEGTHLYVDNRYRAIADASCFFEPKQTLEDLLRSHSRVGFESSFITYEEALSLFKKVGQERFFSSQIVEELRMIKDEKEIALLEKAAKRTKEQLYHLYESIVPGVTEEEIASSVPSPSFLPIIAFGLNSAYPHHRPTKKPYQKGEVILIDVGLRFEGYMGDLTRTFFSPFSAQLEDLFSSLYPLLKPGTLLKELEKCVKKKIPMKEHSLLHGIGIEVHEAPSIKKSPELPLQPGMVLCIEPGIYDATKNGARHEEMILITEMGYRLLA